MRELIKKNWKLGIAFIIGVGLAWASWQFLVVPNYPVLIVDTDAPIEHDELGIGYLPVELTGKAPELGKEIKVCVVPAPYKNFVHNAPDDSSIFSPDNKVSQIISGASWGIVGVGTLAIVVLAIWKKKKQEGK